jgi:hypothetical protein
MTVMTVPSRTASTHLNSLAPRPAKASIAINRPQESASSDCSDTAVSLVFEALAEIGMADKEAAYAMAMDPAQLSRVKSGQARLPIDALWRLPDRFWFAFRGRVDAARHLTTDSARQARAARIGELVRLLVEDVA